MIQDVAAEDLTPTQLYGLLRLRAEVFVVEQDCPFVDPDGRDLLPGTRHVWIEEDGGIVALLRTFPIATGLHVGRVATAPAARSRGLAARLVQHVLDTTSDTIVLGAQSQLSYWYARFGFVPDGPDYLEDDILHTPMRLDREEATA